MPVIVPRWEWRWFGPRFGPAESRLAALAPGAVQESSETYLLSGAGDNVKVRDGLMDIKVLRETNRDGLEQWTPVMKAGFPLPAAEVTRVFAALRLEPPPLHRPHYDLEQFIAELAVPSGHIRAVNVQKRRTRYSIGGCMAEISEVTVDGKPTRTIAVESEDPAAVVAVVRSLGMSGYVNTSYPRGLAALLDGTPARYAVIDVGTNSIKFHVAEQASGRHWRTVADRAEVTRLGEGIDDTGRICDEARERAVAAITGMVAQAQ
jgi:exopolyphosphatase/guanosine-5'-triphosphate,3'-diphosphate pyrophosphatase